MLKKLCAAALFAATAPAMAQGLNYNFIEGSYVVPEEGDGLRGLGSFAFTPNLFGTVEGTYFDFGNDFTSTQLIGQLGYRHALSSTLDLNVTGGFIYLEAEAGDVSADDSGLTFGGLLRAQLTPAFELNGGAQYFDIGDSSEVGFSIGGVFAFTPTLAVVGGGRVIDDSEEFNIGLRYNF